ncbi:MAG: hypothetical protein M0Z48_04250 [Nitrospiraceae bacterium]|nr:hypothetical protein [Nitrospiraceae bacterium]
MRKSRPSSVFLICLQIISLLIFYRLGADALAELAYRSGDIRVLRLAALLDPGKADVFYRLALDSHYGLADRDLNKAISYYKKALVKNPFYMDAWYQLAQACQSSGRRSLAARAIGNYETMGLHSCDDLWRAAVFHLINGGHLVSGGNPAPAYQIASYQIAPDHQIDNALRRCLDLDPESRDKVYGLLLLMGTREDHAVKILPRTKEAYSDYMDYLVNLGGADDALAFWKQAGHKLIGGDAATGLCRLLLADRQPDTAWDIWRQSHGAPARADGPAVIVNGGFGEDIGKTACFGWSASLGPGVDFSYDKSAEAGGDRSLLIRSDGREGSYVQVWQPVIVKPGRSYELAADVKTDNIITAGGVYLGVYGPDCGEFFLHTGELRGTNPWRTLTLDFRPPQGCRIVEVSLIREKPLRLDPKEPSSVWLGNVRIYDSGNGQRGQRLLAGSGG